MSLEDRKELGTLHDMDWAEGRGFYLGLTEPDGGEITLSVEVIPGRFVGVKCDSARARDIAASLTELADITEKWENR